MKGSLLAAALRLLLLAALLAMPGGASSAAALSPSAACPPSPPGNPAALRPGPAFTEAGPGTPAAYRYRPLEQPNPLVEEMIAQVNAGRLYDFVAALSGERPVTLDGQEYTIATRNSFSGEPLQKAAQFLYEHYQSLGLRVSYQEFAFGPHSLQNVIAEKSGRAAPGRIALVAGHYDDEPARPPAPGADDNASGVAAVMLAAEILSEHEFGCTLRFVNFAGEEQGLAGSQAYAHRSACAGEDLYAVLNLDMLAWNTPGSPPQMELHANPFVPGSTDLALLFQDVIETYGLDLEPIAVSPGISASDHASFWAQGFAAILAIEDLQDFNPLYHLPQDRLSNLEDPAYYVEMARASLAALAHLGCLAEDGWSALDGTVVDASSGAPLPGASISIHYPAWDYTWKTASDSDGRFGLTLPAGAIVLTVDSLGYAPAALSGFTPPPGEESGLQISLLPASESASYLPAIAAGPPGEACP